MVALFAVRSSEHARFTFVFYDRESGRPTVEERLLYRETETEHALSAYVQETLYGPITPVLAPLFLPETALLSLLYRKGAVFINLSEEAAFPLAESGLKSPLTIIEEGIRRNFPIVQTVHIFIKGYEIAGFSQ
jgi:hypothetical protein